MRKTNLPYPIVRCVILGLLGFPLLSYSQPALNSFLVGKGKGAVSLSYEYNFFNSYFIGQENISPVPTHNNIDKHHISLQGIYGILNNLQISASIPYVTASGNGDPDLVTALTEANGFMDISVDVLYAPIRFTLLKSDVRLAGSVGFSTPLSDYEPNGFLTLGRGATSLQLKGFAHVEAPFWLVWDIYVGASIK